MPPPPAADPDDVVDAAAPVDAGALARAGSSIERRFAIGALPRLQEVGATDASLVATLGFSEVAIQETNRRPAVDGTIRGQMSLRCQRCLRPVAVSLAESFQVLLVTEERDDEPGGYEPIVTNATRFDVRWLVEEQALLATPLVPMHETGSCVERIETVIAASEPIAEGRQKPFQNLRKMLRER